ncbi:MAG: fibronectin type III domain-containing protein [Nonlabens sp.]
MYKILLSMLLLACCLNQAEAQVLNQPANWPNASWTLGGSYTAGGLLSDPTGAGTTFNFDDDAAGNGSTDNPIVTSPIIDLTAASGAGETWITVSGGFTYRALNGDILAIETYDADADAWSALEVFSGNSTNTDYQSCAGTDGYTTAVLDISGFTATQLSGFQYRFSYDDQSGWNWGFCVTSPTISSASPPSCLDPSALTAINITDTTASLGWTENGTATLWDVEIVTQGTPPIGTPTVSGVGNPYGATALTEDTEYDYYVRADCGAGGTSAWVGPFTFRTACSAIATPYTEDFETFTPSNDAPFSYENCWNATNTDSSYFWESALGTDTSSGGTGPDPTITTGDYFFIEASGSSNGDVAELVSPRVDLTALTDPALSFDYHMFGGQIGTLEVVVNGTTTEWTLSGQQQTSATELWETAIVDLSSYSGQSIAVTFRATGVGTFEGDIAIDNVAFNELPACADPTSLTASSITDTTASLGWTENGTATVWDVEIVDVTAAGAVTGTPTASGVANPYAATGLTQNNDYAFYVRSDCGGGTFSNWVGPFSFSTLETCPTPSALNASNTTETSADLEWTENGAATAWNVEVVDLTAGGSVTGTPTASGVTNPYTATGLTADNNYEFYVQADCGGDGTSMWAGPFAFATTYVAVPPDCSNGVFLDSGGRSSDYGISENNTYTICPDSAGDVVSVTFTSFSTENDGVSCYDGLTIYDGADNTASTIDPPGGGTIWCWDRNDAPAVGSGDLQGMTITSTDPSGCITFIFTSDSSVTRPGWEAVVSCNAGPTCSVPSDLAAGTITSDSAILSWTENGTATAWDIEWGTAGFTQGSGTMIEDTADNPYNLSGLMANTAYKYYVRADCGSGESTWAGPFPFTTACAVFTPAYDVDFSTFLPDCWEEAADGDAASGPTGLGGGNWSQSGSLARVNLFSSNASEWLLTPEFDLSGGPWEIVLEISGVDFGASGFSGMGSDDVVEVLVSTDQGSNWSVIYTFDASSPIPSSATDVSVDLSSYTGASNLFGIRASEGSANDPEDYYVNVHSFEINTPPACPAPSMLMATNIAATSADLGWTENGTATAWDIEWGADGFTQGSGTVIEDTADNPYNLSGLMANTAYEYYVRADCGGDESTWAGPFAFTTACAVVTPAYDVDFSTFLPDCWDEAADGDAASGPTGLGGGNWSQSGSLANVNLFSSNKSEWLLTPEFDLTSGPWEIVLEISGVDFGASGFSGMGSDDVVEVLVSTDQGSSWTVIYTFDASSPIPSNATDVPIDLSSYTGASNLFGIRASEGSANDPEDYYVNVHSFEINTPPACAAPSMLTASNITADSADLGWMENGTATAWDIEWGADGFTQGSGTVIEDTADNPYSLTGLDSNTAYEYYVRADCGGDESAWAGPFSFNTLPDYCGGDNAYDSGGSTGDYGNNEDEIYTFCPESPGDIVVIDFTQFSFENNGSNCYDGLTLYDGANTSASIIAPTTGSGDVWCWDRDDFTPSGSGDLLGRSIVATSASGCITIRLTSDGSATREGFEAGVSCVTPYAYDAGGWNNTPEGNSTSSDVVIVRNGSVNLSTGIDADHLVVNSGAELNSTFGPVNVFGELINNGKTGGASRVIMQGASEQFISGNGEMRRLDINNSNGVNLLGAQDVTFDLGLLDGELRANNNLTLKSNASGTAYVRAISSPTASVSGNVTVERFVPAGNRAYRFLGTSVSGPSIFESWQESGNNSNGFGTHVTGIIGTVGTNNAATGLDETLSGSSSMLKWDNVAQTWNEVTNTKTEILNAGAFYNMFIRGNRAINLNDNASSPNDVTLRATGTLATGDQMITGNATSATFLAVGNPFQSKVDLSLASRSSISDNVYYWDPTLNTQGAYTTIDITTSGAGTNGNATRVLEPGQAVFLQELAGASSIMFSESDKVSGSSNVGILSTPTDTQYLRMKLYHTGQLQAGGSSIDGLIMKFNSSENIDVDLADAVKLTNIDENMAISHSSGSLLSIEKRPAPFTNEVIDLDMNQYRSTDYSFGVSMDPLQGMKVYVKDNMDNSMTEIVQGSGETMIDFTVNANDPASVDTNRFQLVFETVTLSIGSELSDSISIYPNPVNEDVLNIQVAGNVSAQKLKVQLFNSLGQLVRSEDVSNTTDVIQLRKMNDLKSGIYFVTIKGGNLDHTEKVVVE